MTYVDFFVDFAVSGQVAGVGLSSPLAAWPPALGDDYRDASWSAGDMVRQFGFVDAYFEDTTGEWLCRQILVKPDWTNSFAGNAPAVIAERYGEFPARVSFVEIADALAAAGAEVRLLPRVSKAQQDLYWIPAGNVLVSAVSAAQAGDFTGLEPGDIYSAETNTLLALPDGHGTRYR
ncbi:hypothetical protein Ade02nite_72480 [Paractinoplanes deccanensis]|uniref:Uncharacterized protein n=1 Tax=Paractinoplanes deccanensis TaxID=113561 RepID=A0ABQ3YF17_9ACTN|nr:hypothetical protein [Actinoplanes deccanensis]GID78607.1 hypothetical protein Ade02nite_72480 [Actinoplanes deccanensis]